MTRPLLGRRAATLLALNLAALGAGQARGESDFPNQPVRLVVPQSAGSGGDVVARLLVESMGRALGQPVIVDNRPGANGVTATSYLKQQRADGTTLMLAGVSMMSFNPHLYRSLPYDPLRDFTYVAPVVDTPFVLVASRKSGITNLGQLIERAKAAPGEITFASAGIGNSTHLSTEMMADRAGIRLLHVPYNGSGPALTSVVSGETELMTSVLGPALPLIRDGQVTALAVVRRQRTSQIPDVPTLQELGVDAPIMPGWFALVGPAAMPAGPVARLNAAVRSALGEAAVQRRLAEMDLEAMEGSPDSIRQRVESDSAIWGRFIREHGLRID
ncbi:tripartite tricarboxylate transporter substrate binding protein [Belnapia sp. T6]|uniref:Tripartite tricarboxylate transporter substrate binding protein n=1 Tax=Belnapia mucosa TaxID=2804532 RepID=A0ABS1V9B0_9PROT|nr:tripartite tricarboxylate transporter substrate binding protein [Belnapia mucosa]MBL6458249.1 tripartite tricarboxylate transporter substrate binding protein [Belnapia mucosa]